MPPIIFMVSKTKAQKAYY